MWCELLLLYHTLQVTLQSTIQGCHSSPKWSCDGGRPMVLTSIIGVVVLTINFMRSCELHSSFVHSYESLGRWIKGTYRTPINCVTWKSSQEKPVPVDRRMRSTFSRVWSCPWGPTGTTNTVWTLSLSPSGTRRTFGHRRNRSMIPYNILCYPSSFFPLNYSNS